MKYLSKLLLIAVVVFVAGCVKEYSSDSSVLDNSSSLTQSTSLISSTTAIPEELLDTKTNIRKTPFYGNKTFCENRSNYDFEKITLTNSSVIFGESLQESFMRGTNEWYPSINEGRIKNYPFIINNEGCTKFDSEYMTITYKIYQDKNLIFNQEKSQYHLILNNRFEIYPQDFFGYHSGIYENPREFIPFKFNRAGNYTLQVIVYYKNAQIGAFIENFELKS